MSSSTAGIKSSLTYHISTTNVTLLLVPLTCISYATLLDHATRYLNATTSSLSTTYALPIARPSTSRVSGIHQYLDSSVKEAISSGSDPSTWLGCHVPTPLVNTCLPYMASPSMIIHPPPKMGGKPHPYTNPRIEPFLLEFYFRRLPCTKRKKGVKYKH